MQNQYEATLQNIVSILVHYDSDKIVPMYGFGLTDKKQPAHCVQIHTGKGSQDVQGVLQDYKDFLKKDR